MAGDWTKVRDDIEDDPAVIGISSILNLEIDAVVATLVRVWRWAGRHTTNGRVRMFVGNDKKVELVDDVARRVGFTDAMSKVGWLRIEDDAVVFPKWQRHNSKAAKRRALDQRRKSASRTDTKRKSVRIDADKNGTRGEKRREEKILGGKPPRTPVTIEQLAFPAGLDTPEVRTAIQEWLDYKRDRGEAYKRPQYVQKVLGQFERWGPYALVSAINASIGNNWQGLFPGKDVPSGKATSTPRVGPGQRYLGPVEPEVDA